MSIQKKKGFAPSIMQDMNLLISKESKKSTAPPP